MRRAEQSDMPDSEMGLYIQEIAKYPLLEAVDETRLVRLRDAGRAIEQNSSHPLTPYEQKIVDEGRAATDTLITSNLRLVISIAKKHLYRGIEFLDLIQAGNIGLMHGVDLFDIDRDTKISTYVSWWIRQAVNRELANHSKAMRIPVHNYDMFIKMLWEIRNFENSFKREPSDNELAAILKTTPNNVNLLRKQTNEPLSLQTPVRDGENESTIGEFIHDPGLTPEEAIELQDMAEYVARQLRSSGLTEREIQVICLRFGFEDGTEYSLQAIGKKVNLTRERVRQIEMEAIRKLRRQSALPEILL